MGSARSEWEESENSQDIAVVGMGCRFPGARNVNEYWDLLSEPKPQFRRVPDSRWRREAFYNDDFRDSGAVYSDRMALLEDVGDFDAGHYKIPPRRAKSLDPQHRLLVDLTREALQDAGWEAEGFDRDDTSVIMSLSDSGYRDMSTLHLRLKQLIGGEFGRAGDPAMAEAASAVSGLHATAMAGLLLNMGPSSISSVFDLHGESYALDSACSGGLTAVANAVFALRAGRCRIAVAGGAQLVLSPDLFVGLCRIGAISRTGECRPFDRRADGFVLGEGAGVLVLRPLADARAAGDRVYAVIRGVGLSNDGTVKGGMMPQESGQLRALRRAYRDAGVDPASVGFLEAHGTATAVGDDVEISALTELRRGAENPAYLGAAKSVVGHSLGTAGIAGLIKSILSVHKGQILPQPDFEPAEQLPLRDAGLQIAGQVTPWNSDGPRRAGVSAFGFGGSNVHVVVEETAQETPPAETPRLLLLTARDRAGLARHAREVAEALGSENPPLAAVAGTLARRTLFPERLAVAANDIADAVSKLVAASVALESGQGGELGPGVFAGVVSPGEEPVEDGLPAELAPRAVTGSGLRPVADGLPRCTLPPSPLSPRRHWVVDDAKLAKAHTLEPLGAAAASVEEAEETTSARDVLAVVLEEVARTTAFPVSELYAGQLLVDDLGFDSLMLTELEGRLRKRFPGSPVEVEQSAALTVGAVAGMLAPATALVPAAPAQPAPAPSWDPASAAIEEFPEAAAIEARLKEFDDLGVPNPYFRKHQGRMDATTSVSGREYLSFSSYNYLGLAGHPAVTAAVHDAVERYGTSVSGSRLLAGDRDLSRDLETELAAFLGVEDSLVLVSGHATNVGAIGHLVGPGDLIVHDSLAHDSILQGCALSGATRQPFPHNDTARLEDVLRRSRSRFRRVLIVVEGVYSMDGDVADLPALIELKRRYGALLMVDEAHSIGTMGPRGAGIGDHFAVDRSGVDLWMGTLSKSLAGCGGYLAGSARTVRWLRYSLPGFVYSVGITPANAAASLAALKIVQEEPERLVRLRENSRLFLELATSAGLPTGSAGDTPIVPCVVGSSDVALRLATTLYERGVVVDPILYPAVDEELARLRFFITSEHREDQLQYAVGVVGAELGGLR
ncbi:aminotransferase class I/II-fold pyridoxal phosphate-dependent enzyme [Amycolatopsis rubida]|uniref:Aminotransferase class I/II-fold pyridoxal phosphate-dependent enzyme n=1 Tax=Amycolatopsis rubida TaxID=112413 RepID=A0ABX0C1T6_9PSEU|nr:MULTISPECIES: aminotransferase class I/II-fold pyridoxal phosphate-dependent enzyme [Amycolatopsis]MYW96774.1 aminotransferase class I/II-fold pyridoxal phosphate-dependent enzyme [Amycolatopsis rubida]NEC61759.1 aminotransferase class I/II-fold pyridoxal phosphate-dependent enzyme [Amycolatopsis rubida]OAP25754.1 Phthiocerol/phenolphthiocerol synthesis polyketide synthase type I PpsA [Amycolatopsis sp. M39]